MVGFGKGEWPRAGLRQKKIGHPTWVANDGPATWVSFEFEVPLSRRNAYADAARRPVLVRRTGAGSRITGRTFGTRSTALNSPKRFALTPKAA